MTLLLGLLALGLSIWSLVEMREAKRLRRKADALRRCSAEVKHLESIIMELPSDDWLTRQSLRSRQQQVLDEARAISKDEVAP